ncbi:Acetolactate synthase [Salix suchowensis]|nr:Acetolactate synthase [Salix suchowensis]
MHTSRPAPAPGFQQVPTRNHLNLPMSGPGPVPAVPLDHTFVGLSGGQIFHEMMLRHNVKHIFGYPGGAILPVFDAIHNSPYFDFILPRHEQGAGHMAEGYARVSGKPGVILVTSGPGATNVVTPMQDALSDGVPLVVFTGQVATSAIGSDAFQEADIVGISRSCTKWNVMVKDISELPRRINEAFKIATSGRPGPFWSIYPRMLPQAFSVRSNLSLPQNPLQMIEPPTDVNLIRQAAELINQAQRPIIYAGNGILSSPMGPKLLAQLVENGNIPVTTTLQGLGCFDETDERSLHMLGMHGSAYANIAMQQADVIIALGGRFDDRVTGKVDTFAPAARAAALQGRGGIIHFEIQPKNINKVVDASIPILGDVVTNLASLVPSSSTRRGLNGSMTSRHGKRSTHSPTSRARRRWGSNEAARNREVIITTGVGQHQMWAAQHFRWRYPQSLVTSGGLGTMGFGLPSAIGAKVAAPNKMVIDIDGDASFSMTAMELATASQFNIGVKVLVFNNEFQGMVLQWQGQYIVTGCLGELVYNCDELPAKMKEFLEYDGSKPVLMECLVEKDEHVFPMVSLPLLFDADTDIITC